MIRINTHDGKSLELATAEGQTLAQAIFLAGFWDGVPLCAGLGKCGLCRVRHVSAPPEPTAEELKRLGAAALAEGWRLSCLHPAGACHVELPRPKRSARPRTTVSTAKSGSASLAAALAVDLGTTSIHWAALNAAGEVLSSGQGLNPQMGLGSEVMSRLAYAAKPGGAEVLARLATDRLRSLVHGAKVAHGGAISRLCVAGNSAMTCLLLGLPVTGLASAPYRLDYAGGGLQSLAPDLPEALVPPLLAPFVGADLSAGLAALQFSQGGHPAYPYLLADLGTNGEFVLALSPDEYLLASVPMGPALEGVGLRHGRTAAPGAVRGFALTPVGLRPEYIERPPLPGPEGKGEDPGITGVGYLSLAATLRRAGVLDESGRFVVPATPLGKRLAKGLASLGNEQALDLGHGLLLPASDVEELVKVKAAFNLALSRLLAEAGLAPGALKSLHLAGAMGEHVDMSDLATLGFLPEALAGRARRAGNTSLAGARTLLTRPEAWDWVLKLPGKCRTLDLASEPGFGSLYVERMVLRHVA
ncbi:MAG: ASKHA domain-containing protein [Humidesulfovibrio sp.]|uniref:ASKHA domain-containing protein n=1 Tax=Humidesulfovibrio sp. TaxID=2910988 RepID=UPI0027E99FF3|nr:ASKHA domain-containing protein [Humidesulfovibrio sp.]MDQ7833829.1 ASKHA domain-containing protein [Humidesulfovibrio sp.]